MSLIYISENKALDDCIAQLNQNEAFSIDLEFDKNMFRYGFNLCLIQVFASETCFIIDPLSKELDLKRLYPTLEDEKIQKVCFAFGEDLRLLHSLGCFPKNIFDLSFASSLLDYPPSSLATILENKMNITLSKAAQRSNWFQRPLTEKQINYAAEDVRHLIPTRSLLINEAENKGLTEWIKEENSTYDHRSYTDLKDSSLYKEKDKKEFTEYHWHIYIELLEFRESIAKRTSRPSYQIIHKDYLKELSEDHDKLKYWENTRGIYRHIHNQKTKGQLKTLLHSARHEAGSLGLSKLKQAIKKINNEEFEKVRDERFKLDKVRQNFFKPIQTKLAERYGQNAATFMLSNRLITDLYYGKADKLLDYKKKLISQIAEELNLPVPNFLHTR